MKVFRLYFIKKQRDTKLRTKDFTTMDQYENWYKKNSHGLEVKKLLVKDI